MSRLLIYHETTYSYQEAVRFGPHRLVLRPREGHDVRVEEMRLEISPEFDLDWSRDLFGNSVATVHLLSPAAQLRIRSEVVLTQTTPFPLRGSRPAVRVEFPVQFTEMESAVAAAYLVSAYPDDMAVVKEWVARTIEPTQTQGAEAVLSQLACAISKSIKYRRREEKGVQSPAQTLSDGSGSCRDLATLMLEGLRVLGLPARFASGYLDCTASQVGHASTHAWAEAYLPDIGWTGYDPMLGDATSSRHIVAGVSNHPRGVMPVSGTFFGNKESYIGMSVAVRTERLSGSSAEGESTPR
jgi:transglutaminase-like putative cysteine protease